MKFLMFRDFQNLFEFISVKITKNGALLGHLWSIGSRFDRGDYMVIDETRPSGH